ncbi:nucleolar protein 13 [Acrasis kona]|uniref:Nucleolar protein 13 n=1 Tax=Acrasis kona TaxID=1008807 RepID=A0AAW2ZLX5_9EUKA
MTETKRIHDIITSKTNKEQETLNRFKLVQGKTKIKLNIGGVIFTTLVETLAVPGSLFATLFNDLRGAPQEEYFIDRNPGEFLIILDLLRGIDVSAKIEMLPKDRVYSLIDDAKYYGVQNLLPRDVFYDKKRPYSDLPLDQPEPPSKRLRTEPTRNDEPNDGNNNFQRRERSFSPPPYPPREPQQHGNHHEHENNNPVVMVSNLSFDCSEQMLRVHFGNCGTIEKVRMPIFEDSGRCRGFAFVYFTDIQARDRALEMSGTILEGRLIKTKVAEPLRGERGNSRYNKKQY